MKRDDFADAKKKTMMSSTETQMAIKILGITTCGCILNCFSNLCIFFSPSF